MVEYKDYYKIMGLERSATQEDIKRAYRKLARKYHPDVSKEPDAEEKFKALGEAYEVLKNPEKRAQYDELGSYWQQQSRGPSQDYSQRAHADPEQARKFEDFINSIFGGQESSFYSSVFDQGQDIHARVQINLEDSYHGAEKTLQLSRPQIDAHGRVLNQPQTIKVKIPKGVKDKQQIRLKGQGEKGRGGKAGDLYLEINIQPHPKFQLDNKDIHLNVSLYPWEAALGTEKAIPTLGGNVKVKIPQITRQDQKIRLKGRGLPGHNAGDQYIHFTIRLPENLTPKAAELYQQLAREYQHENSTQGS